MTGDAGCRVLVLAAVGRDGRLICQTLSQAGIDAQLCSNPEEVSHGISEAAAAVLLTPEALGQRGVDILSEAIRKQPPWSDVPVLILMPGGEISGRMKGNLKVFESLGNTALLERPLRTTTLVSVVRTALRARLRQYEIRDHMLERTQVAEQIAERTKTCGSSRW